tara:strand:+ start:5691 stop:6686 length:996 start_codon:yes stop_codon:yes gene_type:complete
MSEAICRICFEPESKDNKLINPCLCTGTSKFVHEKCLQLWRDSAEINTPNRRTECMECKYKYIIVEESNKSLCIIFMGSILTNKRLILTPFISFIICYTIGDLLCSESFTRSWTLPDDLYNCYNIAPFSITGLYILLILFYEILLFSYTKNNSCSFLAEISVILVLSTIIIFTLGPLGITLISAIINIVLQSRYIDPMINYLNPSETILNYEPESPKSNILRHLEYMPPSPSPCRNRDSESEESELSVNLCIETNSSLSSNSSQTPSSAGARTPPSPPHPNSNSNSPINSIINTSTSHFRPISPNVNTSRPRLDIPPEINIVYTNENILHT